MRLILLLTLMLLAETTLALQLRFVDVIVNGKPQPQAALLADDNQGFYAALEQLRDWRVAVEPEKSVLYRQRRYYQLQSIPGTQVDYDPRTLTLKIDFQAKAFQLSKTSLLNSEVPEVTRDRGAYFDYDLSYIEGDESSFGSFFSPAVFGKAGSLEMDFAYRSGFDDEYDGWERLATTFTRDDPQKMRSLRLGDVFSMPGPWGGAYRLGGVQIASNFSTRPAFVTFALPSLDGVARLPSAVDVYVNGALRYQDKVDAGGFRINEIPAMVGAGDVRMVVTDILGRESVINQSFYASNVLLKPGLAEYSYTVGELRKNYGQQDDGYERLSFVGSHRLGISERLTVGAQLQGNSDVVLSGVSMAVGASDRGVFSAAVAGSEHDNEQGVAWRLDYQFSSLEWRFGAQASGTSSEFRLLDNGIGPNPPTAQYVINAGLSLPQGGSLGATFVRQEYRDRLSRNVYTLRHSRIVAGEWSLGISANYIRETDTDYGFNITLSRSFGERSSVSSFAGISRDDSRLRVEAARSLPLANGFGYRLGMNADDSRQYDAVVSAQNDIGWYSLEAQSVQGKVASRVSTRGSLAWLSGQVFAAREIGEGFAVANLQGYQNVRVYLENQEIGRSDDEGMLLLPALRPYEVNRVRIEPDDLPMGALLGDFEMSIVPGYRSGSIASFSLQTSHSVRFYAQLPDGQRVPEGAHGVIADSDARILFGLDGMAFATGLSDATTVDVHMENGICRVRLPRPADKSLLFIEMGVLTCHPII